METQEKLFLCKNNKGEKDLKFLQTLLSVCGATSIVGGRDYV